MIPPGKTHSVRLCATFVRTVNVPGRYGDGYGGHGLSLLVTPRKSGGFSKTWAQAISPNGAKTSLGLGSYPVVTLAMARERALANARAIAEGRDPRRRMQKVPTFEKANETVVAIHTRHWKSKRTEGQWRASMRDYVLPRLARKRVDAVTTADVMAVLLPIWSTKRVTAGRVRQRIGAVMKWAVAQGYRDDNPAGDVLSAALQGLTSPAPAKRTPPLTRCARPTVGTVRRESSATHRRTTWTRRPSREPSNGASTSAFASAPLRTKSPPRPAASSSSAWTRSTKCSGGSKAASDRSGGRSGRCARMGPRSVTASTFGAATRRTLRRIWTPCLNHSTLRFPVPGGSTAASAPMATAAPAASPSGDDALTPSGSRVARSSHSRGGSRLGGVGIRA